MVFASFQAVQIHSMMSLMVYTYGHACLPMNMIDLSINL